LRSRTRSAERSGWQGRHARLNFGDCFVYACAKLSGKPLLFRGGDFQHTDLILHPASVLI
jgi:ribonuclease VapC